MNSKRYEPMYFYQYKLGKVEKVNIWVVRVPYLVAMQLKY